MQTEVDVGEFVVEYGTGVHQVSHQRLSAQAAPPREAGRFGCVGSVESASATFMPKVQRIGFLLQANSIDARFKNI